MRRLPVFSLFLITFAVLVTLPALAQLERANGTWVVKQGFCLNNVDLVRADCSPVVELLHMDVDKEVREISSLFHEGNCGKTVTLSPDLTMVVPFTASLGIGHWKFSPDSISVSSYHVLYSCSGEVLGIAWAIREATPEYSEPITIDGNGIKTLVPPGTLPFPQDPTVLAWEGVTTYRFFTLTGEPLEVPLFSQPLPDGRTSVTELSGPFRAERAFGEPTR